jgi:threonine dehydratase
VPAAVVAPLGGGGLVTGLACALADEAGERLSGEPGARRRVWGAQSEACPAMAQSLAAGHAIVRLEADATLADGLEGGISRNGFARARRAVAGVAVLSESAIAKAMAYGVRELGLVLEGSAACALAPLLEGLPPPLLPPAGGEGADLVVVLSGRNVDRGVIDRVLAGAAG